MTGQEVGTGAGSGMETDLEIANEIATVWNPWILSGNPGLCYDHGDPNS